MMKSHIIGINQTAEDSAVTHDGDLFSSLHVPCSIFHLKEGSTDVFECVCGGGSEKGKIFIFFFPFFLSFQ